MPLLPKYFRNSGRLPLWLLIFFLGLWGNTFAQKPEIIKFEQVEEWMTAENDTTYVLNFWATWCRPCVAELPHFNQLAEEYAAQPVKVILISLDFVEDYQSKLIKFLKKRPQQPTVVLLDEPNYNDWIDKVSPEWSGALPATLVSRPRDRKSPGFFEKSFETYEDLISELKPLIHE